MLKAKLSHVATSIIVGCLVINTSLSPTFAQSTDRDNPTPLTTNVLSGRGLPDRVQVFYYRFTAKPGKMAITLDINPRDKEQLFSMQVYVETLDGQSIDLKDPDGEKIPDIDVSEGGKDGSPVRKVKKFELKKEIPVVLKLIIDGGNLSDYTYRLKIDGNWKELTKSESNPRVLNRPIY